MTLVEETCTQERITDLLVRYWGMGKGLNAEECEELLQALDEENKEIGGPIHRRALERLRDAGVE